MDEASLIDRCRLEDSRAQRQLYDIYSEQMLPVCIRYLRHLPAAEDAMITGFYKFFRNLKSFEYRGAGSVRALIKKIMINECLMLLRSNIRTVTVAEQFGEVEESGIDPLAGLQAKDILQCISALPDGYRTVFNLYAVEGYTHREIAAALGISEGTSKSQLSKAKNLLRHTLKTTGCHAGG